MKRKIKLSIILLTLIFSIIYFPLYSMFPTVKATYVEGPIDIDTVWTLVDSPFVISGNVTINENVTLTVEPGVEVRFGGKFSIIVNGRLIANGTEKKPITFTSNKESLEIGDWETILFNGTGQPKSWLTHCVVEYGTYGVTTMAGSSLTVYNSVLRLNSESGIRIYGDSDVTMQNNTITLNKDGVTLEGTFTSPSVKIDNNHITLNWHSGILLMMDEGNAVILNNTVYENYCGFYVAANASTLITRNYIISNNIGVLYDSDAGDHEAHFNNIVNNTVGMDVTKDITEYTVVNATYNYWGHESGPYHESLNPHGKGNPVDCNGVDIKFVFFLSKPIDYNNSLPTAVLWADKTLVAPGQTVTFVGADSQDDGRVDWYFYDFGNGHNSSWTTLTLFFYHYDSVGDYTARLMVKDDFGSASDYASMPVHVQDLTPLDVRLTLSNSTVDYNEEIKITAYVSLGGSPVENANVTLFSVKGGVFTPSWNLTDSSGYFEAVFKAPNVTEVTDVRIMARASKSGYADGSDYQYVKVLPPLNVHIDADYQSILSEDTAKLTVTVTDAFEAPVENVSLKLSTTYGDLSETEAFTDQNGTAILEFYAPMTLENLTATISVEAWKEEYAKGYCEFAINIRPRILVMEISAEPITVLSEETVQIKVNVYCEDVPVSGVLVSVSSDNGGNFSETEKITGSTGEALFVFGAPLAIEEKTVTVSVSATKEGYVSVGGQIEITVMPKVLVVQVTAERNATISEDEISVTVHVEYDGKPVQEANVTLSADAGEFSATTAYTDAFGNATLIFKAPPVENETLIVIIATASKYGYASNSSSLLVTVTPGNLTVDIAATWYAVRPEKSSEIMVYVKCNDKPVANAAVAVSVSISPEGAYVMYLNATSALTDSDGYCAFNLSAPATSRVLSLTVSVEATKYGYVSASKSLTIEVLPEEGGGIPLMTIVLILIPVLLAVVFVVLVKLGVISISMGEEESSGGSGSVS